MQTENWSRSVDFIVFMNRGTRKMRKHALVSLAQTALLDAASNAYSRELHLKAGDAAWYSERIAHTLKNLSAQDVQFLTVEFK